MLSLVIPPQKLSTWFRRPQLWATVHWQLYHDNMPDQASHLRQFFGKTSNNLGDSAPLQPCDFCLFPKLKSPLKGKRFHTVDNIQENATGQLMETGRTLWGPKVPTLKGTEVSLSYIQCFLYLVSSSINVSIFHIALLEAFWTNLVHKKDCGWSKFQGKTEFSFRHTTFEMSTRHPSGDVE